MLESGAKKSEYENINTETDLLYLQEITSTSSTKNKTLSAYDFIIPVFHNTTPLAFVLIGDVDEEKEGVSPTIKHLSFIQTLTNVIFVAIENKRLYNENLAQERIKKEMELASKMQNMLVPDANQFPKNKYISIESFYLPHFEVGGDYYDFEQVSEDELFFCIADVSGKGISAAILMSNFQASLKAYLHSGLDLPDLVSKLNHRVSERAQGEKFITVFFGKYNFKTSELRYINAGHNPPYLYDKHTKKRQALTKGCVGMGMLDELPTINEGVIKIKNNSKLLCYTDGVAELDYEGVKEGGLIAIEKSISDNKSIKEDLNFLFSELNINKSNPALFDDITILGVEFFL